MTDSTDPRLETARGAGVEFVRAPVTIKRVRAGLLDQTLAEFYDWINRYVTTVVDSKITRVRILGNEDDATRAADSSESGPTR